MLLTDLNPSLQIVISNGNIVERDIGMGHTIEIPVFYADPIKQIYHLKLLSVDLDSSLLEAKVTIILEENL